MRRENFGSSSTDGASGPQSADSAELVYRVAVTLLPSVGTTLAKRLIDYFGSEKAVINAPWADFRDVAGIGDTIAKKLAETSRDEILERAQKELDIARKEDIRVLFIQEDDYPAQLKEIPDAPRVLYFRGDFPIDDYRYSKFLSIVGTRHSSRYGVESVNSIVAGLHERGHRPVIVSGLAEGIDGAAHRAARRHVLPTIGVLGNGLGHFYPASHRDLAKEMCEYGGLLTEYPFHRAADKGTFLQRNRIIAGLSHATLVAESGVQGGAMVTAARAQEYNRDVLAIPGSVGLTQSAGCNALIKHNIAALVENAEDVEKALGWTPTLVNGVSTKPKEVYQPSPTEQQVLEFLRVNGEPSLDEVYRALRIPANQLSFLMLNLEFEGLVMLLPGRRYKLK